MTAIAAELAAQTTISDTTDGIEGGRRSRVTTATCSETSTPWRPPRVATALSRMEDTNCSRVSASFARGMRWGLA